MPFNPIYRDFSLKLSKEKCAAFLQDLVRCNGSITSTSHLKGFHAQANHWTMLFRLCFVNQEDLNSFHNLGYVTTEPPKIKLNSSQSSLHGSRIVHEYEVG